MAHETPERELLRLESDYWQAVKDKNLDAALRLTADPCLIAGAQGVLMIDRDMFMRMMRVTNYTLDAFELRNPRVSIFGNDVAVVAYDVDERITVNGETLTLHAADASTWVKQEGRWVCALHTESLRGDPYGRDRTSAPPPP